MRYTLNINNQTQIFDLNEVAKQANSGILLTIGKSVVLATIAREDKKVEEDFLPLTVSYIEKSYAAGRFPGGYIKRETKPGDFETLSSRIVDRSLRPLFPKGYLYPTQIVVMVLSADDKEDLQTLALNAASVALYLSDIPIKAPVCGVRVGCINGELVINPNNHELEKSSLDLFVSGVKDELLMIEMRALADENNMNEFSEDEILNALEFAKKAIHQGSSIYEETFKEFKKTADLDLNPELDDENIRTFISQNYHDEIKQAINQMAKSERASELNKITDKILLTDTSIQNEWTAEAVSCELGRIKKQIVREQILNDRVRADGRKLDEVRPIDIKTNILPMAHGSCLFTRGQTQALVVATLGGDGDAQMQEFLTSKTPVADKFIFHYNFPGFSVGEASPLKAPGRRELGHGNLAKRAINPSIKKDYPHTIRLVSEILESNGSSSMASVCGGAMALRAAGVDSIKLVAGVAMGLITEDDKYAVLTDIMGLEDHDGDMDFKVAGSKDGITALQMDIKLGGIDTQILQNALYQAQKARLHILEIMEKACDDIVINEEVLPKLEIFYIEPSKIPDIIGSGGKTIREIIEKFAVNIDLEREKGEVKISGHDVSGAKDYILENILKDKSFDKGRKSKKPQLNVGDEFSGIVKSIVPFGAFVELEGCFVDGLLHASKTKGKLIREDDKLKVKISEIKGGKIALDLV